MLLTASILLAGNTLAVQDNSLNEVCKEVVPFLSQADQACAFGSPAQPLATQIAPVAPPPFQQVEEAKWLQIEEMLLRGAADQEILGVINQLSTREQQLWGMAVTMLVTENTDLVLPELGKYVPATDSSYQRIKSLISRLKDPNVPEHSPRVAGIIASSLAAFLTRSNPDQPVTFNSGKPSEFLAYPEIDFLRYARLLRDLRTGFASKQLGVKDGNSVRLGFREYFFPQDIDRLTPDLNWRLKRFGSNVRCYVQAADVLEDGVRRVEFGELKLIRELTIPQEPLFIADSSSRAGRTPLIMVIEDFGENKTPIAGATYPSNGGVVFISRDAVGRAVKLLGEMHRQRLPFSAIEESSLPKNPALRPPLALLQDFILRKAAGDFSTLDDQQQRLIAIHESTHHTEYEVLDPVLSAYFAFLSKPRGATLAIAPDSNALWLLQELVAECALIGSLTSKINPVLTALWARNDLLTAWRLAPPEPRLFNYYTAITTAVLLRAAKKEDTDVSFDANLIKSDLAAVGTIATSTYRKYRDAIHQHVAQAGVAAKLITSETDLEALIETRTQTILTRSPYLARHDAEVGAWGEVLQDIAKANGAGLAPLEKTFKDDLVSLQKQLATAIGFKGDSAAAFEDFMVASLK